MVKRADYSKWNNGVNSGASVCMECKGKLDGELTIEWGKSLGTNYRYIGTYCSYECHKVWVEKNGDQSSVVTESADD